VIVRQHVHRQGGRSDTAAAVTSEAPDTAVVVVATAVTAAVVVVAVSVARRW
jgi:hypothetical protein